MIRSFLLLLVVLGVVACGDPADESRAASIATDGSALPVGADGDEESAAQRLLVLLLGGSPGDESAQVFAGISGTTRMSSPDPMPGRQRDDGDDGTGIETTSAAGTTGYR